MFMIDQIVVIFIPLLFAVTIHETAHGYVAYRRGDATAKSMGRLTLNPIRHLDWFGSFLLPVILKPSGSPVIFGYAKPVPVNFGNLRDYRRGMISVASAGVLANLALAVVSGALFQILLCLSRLWYDSICGPFLIDLLRLLGYSAVINSVLTVFNVVPIPPLDGSRIPAAMLPAVWKDQFDRIEQFGMIIIILLLFTSFIDTLISFFVDPLLHACLGSEGIAFIFNGMGDFK
jgi:Zn-dependent protease